MKKEKLINELNTRSLVNIMLISRLYGKFAGADNLLYMDNDSVVLKKNVDSLLELRKQVPR